MRESFVHFPTGLHEKDIAMIRMLALAGLGYAGYRYFQNQSRGSHVAFAGDQNGTIRDAGPAATRSDDTSRWTREDVESDASFPASDPPANY